MSRLDNTDRVLTNDGAKTIGIRNNDGSISSVVPSYTSAELTGIGGPSALGGSSTAPVLAFKDGQLYTGNGLSLAPIASKAPRSLVIFSDASLANQLYSHCEYGRSYSPAGVFNDDLFTSSVAAPYDPHSVRSPGHADFFSRANALLGYPLVIKALVASYTGAQTLASAIAAGRLDVVKGQTPDIVLMFYGLYDFAAGSTLESVQANVISVINSLGINIIIPTLPVNGVNPSTAAPTLNMNTTVNPAYYARVKAYNEWLKSLPKSYKNVFVWDYASLVANATVSADTIRHPNNTAVFSVGDDAAISTHMHGQYAGELCQADFSDFLQKNFGLKGFETVPLRTTAKDKLTPIYNNGGAIAGMIGQGFAYTGFGPSTLATASTFGLIASSVPGQRLTGVNSWVGKNIFASKGSLVGCEYSFRTQRENNAYPGGQGIELYILVGRYVISISQSSNTVSLYNMGTYPTNTVAWSDATNRGSLVSSWTLSGCPDAAFEQEKYIVEISGTEGAGGATIKLISCRYNVILFTQSGLTFNNADTTPNDTLIGVVNKKTTDAYLTVGQFLVIPTVSNGNIGLYDPSMSGAGSTMLPASFTDARGTWAAGCVVPNDWGLVGGVTNTAAYYPNGIGAGNGAANGTITTSMIAKTDGSNYWRWSVSFSAAGGSQFALQIPAQFKPGRIYRLVVPYKLVSGPAGATVFVDALISKRVPNPAGSGALGANQRWYRISTDYDTVANAPGCDAYITGATQTPGLNVENRFASHFFTFEPGSCCDCEELAFTVSSSAAGTVVVDWGGFLILDVTDLYYSLQ